MHILPTRLVSVVILFKIGFLSLYVYVHMVSRLSAPMSMTNLTIIESMLESFKLHIMHC